MRLARLFVLSLFTTGLLVSCDFDLPSFAADKPVDTFRTVTERYQSGQPRYVSYSIGPDSQNADTWKREILSPSGNILKRNNFLSGDIKFYEELNPGLDSAEGLKNILQGMWEREEALTRVREVTVQDKKKMIQVKTNVFRTFTGDTLVMNRTVDVLDPRKRKFLGRKGVEVAFDVRYLPPNRVLLENVLYRRKKDSTQILSETPMLPPELRGRVVDTLRFYGPKQFRIMSPTSAGIDRQYDRILDINQVRLQGGAFPEELRR